MRENPVFRSGRMQVDYDHVETRGVLGGAYLPRHLDEDRPTLTHLVFVGPDDSFGLRTGCRQPIDNMVDTYGASEEESAARPTCPTCAKKWDKIPAELRGRRPEFESNARSAGAADRDLEEGNRSPNPDTAEWVPSEKRLRSIPSWGEHDFAWWKRQTSRGGEYSHPKVWIEVSTWEADGSRGRGLEFTAAELKQAKAAAKAWVEQGGMSASVEGHVRIAGMGDYVVQTFGEYRSKEDRGTYVWDVNADGVPFSRKGPYSDVDEAYRDARSWAMSTRRDHVVTFGSDPKARSFEILKGYKGWSGEVYFTSELARVGSRLGEYR